MQHRLLVVLPKIRLTKALSSVFLGSDEELRCSFFRHHIHPLLWVSIDYPIRVSLNLKLTDY